MTSAAREALLAELAALCGIEPEYYDVAGRRHVTTPETQESLLTAMGCRCGHLEELRRELARRRPCPWSAMLEPVLALSTAQLPATWNLYLPLAGETLPADLAISWAIFDEPGRCCYEEQIRGPLPLAEVRRFDDTAFGRVSLPLPPELTIGYYQLHVNVQGGLISRQGQMLLVLAPPQVYTPAALRQHRLWGLQLPLYALASRRNWGIGDCGDLQRLIPLARELNAACLGLNPLHHLGVAPSENISPYYPTSRCFPDPLYLDLEQVPELAVTPQVQEYLAAAAVQDQLTALRQGQQVNYAAVAQLKKAVLVQLFAAFLEHHGEPQAPRTARGQEFAGFLNQQGQLLQDFATFLALAEFCQEQQPSAVNWQDWPGIYHDPASPAVAAFQQERRHHILRHVYAQWLLAGQLAQTQRQAQAQGLAPGLYLDLAVGVNPGGFDTWRHQDLFAHAATIGAPPDDFSPLGQNWHLVPLAPQALRNQGYRYLIQVLQHNCLPGGALRIDHVMGFFRLYWIPQGATAAQGAYVRYPATEMLHILTLESTRRQTLVIGEDLGTVAPWIREELAARQVFSTRLFYFEFQPDGSCRPADQYPAQALAAITTHDLPTLAGFWQGRDIQVRQNLHLFPDDQAVVRAYRERQQAKAAIVALLADKGWLSPDTAATVLDQAELPEAVKWGVIAHLAQTPCRLVLLSLEDIFGWLDQQNLPGTKDEYPNWRLKLPLMLEEFAQAPQLAQVATIMRQYQRGSIPPPTTTHP
ncbi:MAG: 4-alpha-glucanotransferase [Desulfobacca sp.]|uniref:4-alpha-glucanotransferase n=1 Tax=Desulfobacca sp. TaxID=2067990 RepID=UPI00404B78FD